MSVYIIIKQISKIQSSLKTQSLYIYVKISNILKIYIYFKQKR